MDDKMTPDDEFELLLKSYQDRTAEYLAALQGITFAAGSGKLDLWRAANTKLEHLRRIEAQMSDAVKNCIDEDTRTPTDPAAARLMHQAAKTVGWTDAPAGSAADIANWCRQKTLPLGDPVQRYTASEWVRRALVAARTQRPIRYVVVCLSNAKQVIEET